MNRLLVAFLFVVSLAGAAPALAAEETVFLEDMTWTEVRDAVAAGRTTVIVPVGGTEQSGPHMALGKHNVRAHVLAGRIAAQLGNALVAPVVAYVPEGDVAGPSGHIRFAGTISVSPEAFKGVLEGAARSFRRAGFRDIVLIGDHGGYQSDLAAVAAKLNREWAKTTPVRVHFVAEYYKAATEPFAAALRRRGLSEAQIGSHAGSADTSLMLAVDPRLVRADRLTQPPVAADGTYGDPRASSAALGEAGVALIVRASVNAIRKATVR
jgi:creatinine amidohydrolase/Fe(II)-dependent formamide hydrolase-like protein